MQNHTLKERRRISIAMRANDSQPAEDALIHFCEDLLIPLEQLGNSVYLATHSASDSKESQYYLCMADEILAGIRKMVLTHCRKKAA